MACDVSAVIPTFNRLASLQKAVTSVWEQAPAPRELIVIDDGSTDGTWEWLKSLSHPAVKIFRQENTGPGAARNLGAAAATSKYLAFLDSDDYWLAEKLGCQVEFLEKNPDYRLCQTEEIWLRRGKRVNPKVRHSKPSGWVFEACLRLCLLSPSAVMLHRDFFLRLGGFDPHFPVCEDYELWLRASLCSPVMTLPSPLTVKQGGHPDQLSKKFPAMDRFRLQAMEKILRSCFLTPGQKEALLAELKTKLQVLARGFPKHQPGRPNPYEDRWLQLQNERPFAPTAVNPGS